MTEGCLHRALASYVRRRALANENARPSQCMSMIIVVHQIWVFASGRSGHTRMAQLKEVVRMTRASLGQEIVYMTCNQACVHVSTHGSWAGGRREP